MVFLKQIFCPCNSSQLIISIYDTLNDIQCVFPFAIYFILRWINEAFILSVYPLCEINAMGGGYDSKFGVSFFVHLFVFGTCDFFGDALIEILLHPLNIFYFKIDICAHRKNSHASHGLLKFEDACVIIVLAFLLSKCVPLEFSLSL